MTTDGTKTIYSWDNDKGEIAQKTERVKRYSDSLENPLDIYDDCIKLINTLIEKEKTGDTHAFLLDIKERIERAEATPSEEAKHFETKSDFLQQAHRDLTKYLEQNLDLATKEDLKALNNVLAKLFIETTDKLLSFTSDRFQDAADLDIDRKILSYENIKSDMEMLINRYDMFFKSNDRKYVAESSLETLSEEISLAKNSNIFLWDQGKISDAYSTPDAKYIHRVIIQLEDDNLITENSANSTGKYFENSTLIHMNKEGEYRIVYGLKFNEIPKGEIEFEFQGHGNNVNKTIGKRSSSDIVDITARLNKFLPDGVLITKTSIKGCNPGFDFGKEVLEGYREKNIKSIERVSARATFARATTAGRQLNNDMYHINGTKDTWVYDETTGKATLARESYTDDHYHAVITVGEDGELVVEKTQDNKRPIELTGNLKIRVKANGTPEQIKKIVLDFKKELSNKALLKQVNLKMVKDHDWSVGKDMLTYGKLVQELSQETDTNVLSYSDTGEQKGVVTYYYKDAKEIEVFARKNHFTFNEKNEKNIISLVVSQEGELDNIRSPMKFSPGVEMHAYIEHNNNYPQEELLSQIESAVKISDHPISSVKVFLPSRTNDDYRKNMISFLSTKLNVSIELSNEDRKLLSKDPNEPILEYNYKGEVVRTSEHPLHLAETTPHKNTPLQN
jgi:hypothetical protein